MTGAQARDCEAHYCYVFSQREAYRRKIAKGEVAAFRSAK